MTKHFEIGCWLAFPFVKEQQKAQRFTVLFENTKSQVQFVLFGF